MSQIGNDILFCCVQRSKDTFRFYADLVAVQIPVKCEVMSYKKNLICARHHY